MSELADEFARRLEPGYVKAMAADKATELKEQARELATEKAAELKTHAKEAVMRRTHEIKERADTPRGWRLLGAIIGASVGSVLMKKAFAARRGSDWSMSSERRRMYGEYDEELPALVPSPDGGLMRPTRDSSLKDRTSETLDMAKEKASELKYRASDWYDTVSDNPVLLAIGGLAIGALCASFIPVSNRERQLFEPAKSRVKERISELGEQLESSLSGQPGAVSSEEEEEVQASAASESERERGTIPPLPPLEDFTSIH
ncbi:hypothetical protein [Vitiosangium sp. GDMCC 1.1324]|uniref:hypothetical protein n=1 Tax=Vitiosangium sp. (strain GDMCC 1.1324) TaxID=2138576 RepID=UPI00130D8472|nr:hypothetical protein [Vitiosangium sp. GDMCC 1.1324]